MANAKTTDGSMALNSRQVKVITIEATKQPEEIKLRVAAYARVSSSSDDQLNSFAAQNQYYTALIAGKDNWHMVDIYADEGITGTSARKRPEFLRMIRQCRKKKIDVILTKSISRFARNTVDCLNYIRVLKEIGIAVIFEKENINTLETDSEILITMLGAFAQAESESISANVRWGKRQAMREGKAIIQYNHLYGYEKGEDGNAKIIPDQAEVVRKIYEMILIGASLRKIKDYLESEGIRNASGKDTWSISSIRGILSNEKYCGDVLLQKTFIEDCISKKVVKNTGQLPMYLIQNHHEGIVSRKTFDAVQAELARRTAEKSHSKKNAPTGRTSYTSKYALSERLVCGECGTLYQRCTWSRNGRKRIVWRCVSRLEYGTKYCHHSPTLDEELLQKAILNAINSVMSRRDTLTKDLLQVMELEQAPIPGETISLADIERRMEEINRLTREIVVNATQRNNPEAYTQQLESMLKEIAALKEKKAVIEQHRKENRQAMIRIESAADALKQMPNHLKEWDESIIRQLVDTVKIASAERIIVYLKDGTQIEQEITP